MNSLGSTKFKFQVEQGDVEGKLAFGAAIRVLWTGRRKKGFRWRKRRCGSCLCALGRN